MRASDRERGSDGSSTACDVQRLESGTSSVVDASYADTGLMYPAAQVAESVQRLPSSSTGESADLEAVIQDLRDAIRAAEAVDPPTPASQRARTPGQQDSQELSDVLLALERVEWCLETLRRKQPLREFVFPRTVPVVGRLVALVQEQAGRISARWYARYLLQQQNEMNTLLLLSIDNVVLSMHELTRAVARISKNNSTTSESGSTSNGPTPPQASSSGQRRDG